MTSWRTAIAGAAMVFTAAGLLVGCGRTSPTPHPSSPSSPTTKASPSESPSPANVTLILSVTSLPTTYGVPGAPTSYPATVRVSVPASSSRQIAAYGVGGTVVLGPAGWTGSGQVGADGGVAFTLAPAGTSPYPGEELVFQFDGACVGCTWDDASAYFPAVAKALPSAGTGPASSPLPGLQSVSLGAGLVGYSLPATDTKLQLNGVAYTNLPASTASPVFENLEITLPTSQHPLATVILNALVANDDRYLCPSGSAASTTSLVLTTGSC
jgi:hypothetical protein